MAPRMALAMVMATENEETGMDVDVVTLPALRLAAAGAVKSEEYYNGRAFAVAYARNYGLRALVACLRGDVAGQRVSDARLAGMCDGALDVAQRRGF